MNNKCPEKNKNKILLAISADGNQHPQPHSSTSTISAKTEPHVQDTTETTRAEIAGGLCTCREATIFEFLGHD